MLFEHQEYNVDAGPPPEWGDAVFKFCMFEDLDIDGVSFDGEMVSCTLCRVQLYWGFFNVALLANVTFHECVFPGASFRGCHFVECTFKDCRFTLDNLGGACIFDDCTLTECTFSNCSFDPSSRQPRLFSPSTRLYACTQTNCRGMEGI